MTSEEKEALKETDVVMLVAMDLKSRQNCKCLHTQADDVIKYAQCLLKEDPTGTVEVWQKVRIIKLKNSPLVITETVETN